MTQFGLDHHNTTILEQKETAERKKRKQNQTENGETIKFQQLWNNSTTGIYGPSCEPGLPWL